jgi:surfactin synthase thioesterase subunit
MKSIKLFCFPFAGGNKYVYREFEKAAPPFLTLHPLEYPGRGSRSGESLLDDIDSLVTDCYKKIVEDIQQADYSFFGHSMGGLLAFLVARKIMEEGHRPPRHLFITGTSGPSAPSREEKRRHLLSRCEFIEELIKMNGRAADALRDAELFDYLEPIIRSDFKASESYVHKEGEPLNIPMTVITGIQEEMTTEDIELWQKESNLPVEFRRMPGDHFFILDYPEQLITLFSRKLFLNHTILSL